MKVADQCGRADLNWVRVKPGFLTYKPLHLLEYWLDITHFNAG